MLCLFWQITDPEIFFGLWNEYFLQRKFTFDIDPWDFKLKLTTINIKTTYEYYCYLWPISLFYLFPVQQCQVFDNWGYTVMVYTEMLQKKQPRDKIGNVNGKISINIVHVCFF